jgi:hypothetical protein
MLTLTGILFSLFSDLVRAPNLKNRPRRTRTRSRLLRIWLWNQRYIVWLFGESASQRRLVQGFPSSRTISCRAEWYTSDIKACPCLAKGCCEMGSPLSCSCSCSCSKGKAPHLSQDSDEKGRLVIPTFWGKKVASSTTRSRKLHTIKTG